MARRKNIHAPYEHLRSVKGETVYFAASLDGDRVKVGYTNGLMWRMAEIERVFRTRVQVIYHQPGYIPTEMYYHCALQPLALGREWFRLTPDLAATIGALGSLATDCDRYAALERAAMGVA